MYLGDVKAIKIGRPFIFQSLIMLLQTIEENSGSLEDYL
jgi:hypothetical protein